MSKKFSFSANITAVRSPLLLCPLRRQSCPLRLYQLGLADRSAPHSSSCGSTSPTLIVQVSYSNTTAAQSFPPAVCRTTSV